MLYLAMYLCLRWGSMAVNVILWKGMFTWKAGIYSFRKWCGSWAIFSRGEEIPNTSVTKYTASSLESIVTVGWPRDRKCYAAHTRLIKYAFQITSSCCSKQKKCARFKTTFLRICSVDSSSSKFRGEVQSHSNRMVQVLGQLDHWEWSYKPRKKTTSAGVACVLAVQKTGSQVIPSKLSWQCTNLSLF